MRVRQRARVGAALSVAMLAVAACARRPSVEPPGTATSGGARRGLAAPDLPAVYGQMGLLVARGDLPFAGSVARFAGASSDSTLVLLSLSLANRALAFVREGDRYRAAYEVRVEVRRGDEVVRRAAGDEIVRVARFRETARTDESVLFYQYLTLPPASYTLSVAVRDANAGRSASVQAPLDVPRFGGAGEGRGGLSTPVVAYGGTPRTRLDTLPDVAPRPRATAAFGQDSVVALYVEGYGAASGAARLPVRIAVRGDRGALVWSDTGSLARRGGALFGGVLHVPVPRLGIGVVALDVVALDAPDSVRAPVFVSLGDDLPIAGFDDVLGYLRYYATPERLRTLRDAPPEARAAAWAAFLRDSDPSSATPEHEALRNYFARLRTANLRFGDEGTGQPGWTTDRGMAYIVLGEPDQIVDPTDQDPSAKGRTQVWEYRGEKVQLTFADQTGFGRWRLTGQSSAALQAAMRRKLVP